MPHGRAPGQNGNQVAMERRGRDELIEQLMQSALGLAWAVNHEPGTHVLGKRLLTFSRIMALRFLAKTGSCRVSDLAAFLGVSDADASTLADKLVTRKLLHRVGRRSDRRIRELSLTPIALKLLEEYEQARKSVLAESFRKYTSEELQHASEILDRVSLGMARRMRE